MNAELVQGKISSLDSYDTWKKVKEEEQKAYNAVPFEIDKNNVQQLRQQLGYLAMHDAQIAVRQHLKLEIALQNDKFLPLVYRLGVLAALDATNKPLTTKYMGDHVVTRGRNMFKIDTHEQSLRPSNNPLDLAVQIGDELERLRSLLDTNKSVPVVMVWNHRFIPPRIDYDEVVLGELPNPRDSFIFEEPVVKNIDGTKVVDYKLPTRLHGVKKGVTIWRDGISQPEEKYSNPILTTLERLGVVKRNIMSHDPDALYIGKVEVVERVAKAEQDRENYERKIKRLSRSYDHI